MRIRQGSYACLLFKSSKYLSEEVMNFYIDNLNTLCGHTTALHTKFPTSYTFDIWALFQIIILNAKEYSLINFTNLVSDHEAMEALYGESYDELLLSKIDTWYQCLPKTISKVLEHYKTHNIETEFLFFMKVNKCHWAFLIADIKNRKITSIDSMQGICEELFHACMMLLLYLGIYFSNKDINNIENNDLK